MLQRQETKIALDHFLVKQYRTLFIETLLNYLLNENENKFGP